MRRFAAVLALIIGLSAISASAYDQDRYGWGEAVVISGNRVVPDPTLVDYYEYQAIPGKSTNFLLYFYDARYRPRAWNEGYAFSNFPRGLHTVTDTGGYDGYDLFTATHGNYAQHVRPDALLIGLNRPACVGIVWRSDYKLAGNTHAPIPIPDWMDGYTPGNAVTVMRPWLDNSEAMTLRIYPTYWTAAEPGVWEGGAIADAGDAPIDGARESYWVLIAERDGETCAASDAPGVPPEHTEAYPSPNQACPAWLHDIHQTTGPDGEAYSTWHRQIDPIYWCYYGHDHGGDPDHALPGYEPPYGYAARQAGMNEPDPGFKTLIFDVPEGPDGFPATTAILTFHMGTSGLGRMCARYHSFDLVLVEQGTETVLLRYRLTSDTGAAITSRPPAEIIHTAQCPTENDAIRDEVGSSFVRQIPMQPPPGTAWGYEPWRFQNGHPNVTGGSGSMVINTFDPIIGCTIAGAAEGPYCEPMAILEASGIEPSGTGVFLQAGNYTIRPTMGGLFCTDPAARSVVQCGDPSSIEQYVDPSVVGKAWYIPFNKCDSPSFGLPWRCGENTELPNAERENSIPEGGPN